MRPSCETTTETFSPDKRPDIGSTVTVGADDLHRLPASRDRGADLHDPRVGSARIGVDFLKQCNLVLEGDSDKRVAIGVERHVAGRYRWLGGNAGVAAGDGRHTVCSALQGGFGQLAGMCIAMCLAGNGAEPETAGLVIAGTFQPPVIDHQHFGMPHFKKQLTIICIDKGVANNGLGQITIERAAAEEYVVGGLEMIHIVLFPAPEVPLLHEFLLLRMGRWIADFKREGGHSGGTATRVSCRPVKITFAFF